jgi:Secretion system C-terminal sorting domain
MKFGKILVVLFVMFFTVNSAFTQITLTMDDMRLDAGTTIMMSYSEWSLTPGVPGSDENWDFSSLGEAFTSTNMWDNPEGHYGAESFPTANRCNVDLITAGAVIVTYYEVTATTLTTLGAAYHTEEPDTTYPITIETSGPNYTFPLNYGDEWDLRTSSVFFGNESIDSTHFVVDAWGVVTTGYGATMECLRIFAHSFDLDEANDAFNYHYYWLVPGIGTACYAMSEDNPAETNFTGGTYMWVTSIEGDVGVEEIGKLMPSMVNLNPAYPNPFNAQTRITFDLEEANLTSLKVYDIQGRLVANLVSGPIRSGHHEVNFNGNDLASGTYLIQLESGGFQQTSKIQLIK